MSYKPEEVYPLTNINGRLFYACMGVLVNKTGGASGRWGRLTQTGDDVAADAFFLTGVQSVGISSDNPSSSLMDVGRFQKKYHYYAPQEFEITIERVITETENFFYSVDPSSYAASDAGYKDCHILSDDNIGCQGSTNPNSKSIRNFDITVIYGPDQFNRLGSDNYTTPTSSNPDKNKAFEVTYRNCLLKSISYSMSIGASITESITLTTRASTYSGTVLMSQLDLPSEEVSQTGNILKPRDLDLLNTGSEWGPRFSVLPEEVERMFKAKDKLGNVAIEGNPAQEIVGLNSISIEVAIDYSEIMNVGEWKSIPTDQGEQNLWRYVVVPVQVSSSFTGLLRQPFPRIDDVYHHGPPTSYLPNVDNTFSEGDGDTNSIKERWPLYHSVDREIRLVAKKFTVPDPYFFVWDLGKKNYLTGFSYDGGGTDGGNLEGTISYQNDASDIVLSRDTIVRDLPAPVQPY